MDGDRFARWLKWTAAGGAVGYTAPLLISWLTVVWSQYREGELGPWDAPAALLVVVVVYTWFGGILNYVLLGAGCGLACAWLPPRLGRWRRLAALTVLVVLAALAGSAIGWPWFTRLWSS